MQFRWLMPALCFFATAQAHHGPGQFDSSLPVEVTGVVTDIRLVNPHGYVYFDVTEDDGSITPWRCELQAGSLHRRAGWTDDLFPIGGEITVTGDRGSREETACALRTVILADGRTLNRYDQISDIVDAPTGAADRLAADGTLDLNGSWAAPQRNPGGGARPGGGMGPGGMGPGGMGPGGMGGGGLPVDLTAAGLAAVEGLSHEVDNPRFSCMPVNIFFDWEFDRHVNEIVQTDATITLRYGFMDIERTVYLDMDEHPADIEPSRAGHSIGRWEDGDLVVDTVGFADGFIVAGPGGVAKHSDQLHAVERFSYDAATQGLTRTYWAEDPLYFNGRYTGEDTVFVSNVPFEPYSCLELKDDYIEN